MSRAASRLSQAFVDRLITEPAMGDVFHWDSALPGFGIRVFASGRISWVVQYRMSDRRQPGDLSAAKTTGAKSLGGIRGRSGTVSESVHLKNSSLHLRIVC